MADRQDEYALARGIYFVEYPVVPYPHAESRASGEPFDAWWVWLHAKIENARVHTGTNLRGQRREISPRRGPYFDTEAARHLGEAQLPPNVFVGHRRARFC